ncbi:hypothetical protein [Tropicimonas sp. IMCC6043]|uniref:hypothetical protein n=1 Tax=Tropicimonas sp. IMCC6043 TaxID=2510645 RepID=UPI00101CB7B6|nr:hypothetical protein [Tropicimonas sp. IMCC6043]RYH12334.1 hypothetical protein EU800_01885 [Tropicimonas sp. IMCC6043]
MRPLQNRVLPTGEIVSLPARGRFMGNRGCLHDASQRLGVARWRHPHWICCAIAFRGRQQTIMAPNRYTQLFFLDEAVALAAGHRPCAECRRDAYAAFRDAWEAAYGSRPKAEGIDRVLHAARVRRDRSQIRIEADLATLPDGAFVLLEAGAALLWDGALLRFAPEGYGARRPRGPDRRVTVLTPRPTLAVLTAGYRPEVALA